MALFDSIKWFVARFLLRRNVFDFHLKYFSLFIYFCRNLTVSGEYAGETFHLLLTTRGYLYHYIILSTDLLRFSLSEIAVLLKNSRSSISHLSHYPCFLLFNNLMLFRTALLEIYLCSTTFVIIRLTVEVARIQLCKMYGSRRS